MKSFVKMSSFEVKLLCKKTLKNIVASRELKVQKAINKLKDRHTKRYAKRRLSWWDKLWNRSLPPVPPLPSDDELIDKLKEPGEWVLFSEYQCIQMCFKDQEDVSLRLLNACKHADEITVSTSDLWYIT
jgi:hypothetical protein